MKKVFLLTALIASSLLSISQQRPVTLSDESEFAKPANCDTSKASYNELLKSWNLQSLNQWIGCNFQYSMTRAKLLASNSQSRSEVQILTPQELFTDKAGTCIDLTRFTVESLKQIDSTSKAHYVMIDFEPVTIDSMILRKHWLAAVEKEDGLWFTGDSKQPGIIMGPYKTLEEFRASYQNYRGRAIHSIALLPTYKKKMQKKQVVPKS